MTPYADGGATVVENLELRCRAHNMYEAEQYFGSRLPLLVREGGAPPYLMTTRSGPGSLTSEVFSGPRAPDDQFRVPGPPAT